jgi:IS30 family transposase
MQRQKSIKLTAQAKNWIERLIKQDLSPEQVSGYLKDHCGVRLHHEMIYQYIYRDKANGGLLHTNLRIANKCYRMCYSMYDRRGHIVNRVSIDERPKILDKKVRIGDWEGDTIIGKGHKGALLTLVDRKTLYTIIVPLKRKNAEQLKQAVIEVLSPHKERVLTITYDNGKEFAEHEQMAEALEAEIYFAHPYASWGKRD